MEFVNYIIAKKLKEKGFPQRPDYFNYSSYYDWDGLRKIYSLSNASVWFDPNISRDNIYFAPTIPQVLEWIRKEQDIDIEVLTYHTFATARRRAYAARIVTLNIDETLNRIEDTEMHIKWGDAALWAIEYVVNNMII